MSNAYSDTPLARKLGLKDGQRVLFVGLPEHLGGLAAAAVFARCDRTPDLPTTLPEMLDVAHLFLTEVEMLERALTRLRVQLDPAGMIWVSWPKRASKRPTTITEDVIRRLALPKGLVDVKVCAVDEVWSGLKLVIRKDLRATRT